MKKIAFLVCGMIFPLIGQAADTIYVQSVRANVMSGPAFNSQVVTVAPKGSQMSAQFEAGNWYRVNYNGKAGWVSRYQVSNKPPMKQLSIFDRLGSLFKGDDARRRASRTTVVGAVRGLSAEERARGGHDIADHEALQKMNAMSVDEAQALKFLEEGLAGG